MKRTTILAIVAATAGALVVLYLITRPRGALAPPPAETPALGTGTEAERRAATVRGVGMGLSEVAAAIAGAVQ